MTQSESFFFFSLVKKLHPSLEVLQTLSSYFLRPHHLLSSSFPKLPLPPTASPDSFTIPHRCLSSSLSGSQCNHQFYSETERGAGGECGEGVSYNRGGVGVLCCGD
ncbi:hypothetical protein Droror1_Dr00004809 [Drosera rotundifolia]